MSFRDILCSIIKTTAAAHIEGFFFGGKGPSVSGFRACSIQSVAPFCSEVGAFRSDARVKHAACAVTW